MPDLNCILLSRPAGPGNFSSVRTGSCVGLAVAGDCSRQYTVLRIEQRSEMEDTDGIIGSHCQCEPLLPRNYKILIISSMIDIVWYIGIQIRYVYMSHKQCSALLPMPKRVKISQFLILYCSLIVV